MSDEKSKSSWINEARIIERWQSAEPQEVINIVEELVDGNIDASSAAWRVRTLYEELLKEKPDAITVIWGIVFHAVRAIGQDEKVSTRLRDFILALQFADDVIDEAGEQVELHGQVVWHDLPGFSLMFSEHCINVDSIHDYTSQWLDQAPALLNASTFGALFLSGTTDPRYFSYFASMALIDGLEVSYSQEQTQQATMYTPAAATWLRLAGLPIRKLCIDGYDSTATCRSLETGCTWEWSGVKGFSLERWQFWKQRLGKLATDQGVDERLQSMAREANAEMASIERTVT